MELEPDDVFFLAACEAMRDGQVEPDEEAVLMRLRVAFRIPPVRAARILRKARDTERALDAPPAPLDRTEIFAQCCRLAWIDEELSDDERDILLHLARLLGIGAAQAAALLDAARVRVGPGSTPPARPR